MRMPLREYHSKVSKVQSYRISGTCLSACIPSWGFAMTWTVVETDQERPNIERTHPRCGCGCGLMRASDQGLGELPGTKSVKRARLTNSQFGHKFAGGWKDV